MTRIEVNGAQLGYEERGKGGPPFVFVHGWACDRSAWQPQFDDLSQDHRCVAIDLRGRGESTATPPYDFVTAADDVAAVMDALGISGAIVAGHSLGGIIVLALNLRRPELLRGVVIGDSPLTADTGANWPRTVGAIRSAGSMEPARSFVESFFTPGTPPKLRQRLQSEMMSAPADVAAGMLERGDYALETVADMVKAADEKAFMAIWAEKPLGDPAYLRDSTRFARQEPIPGTGHFFQLEQPQITTALLRSFIDDVERDPRLAAP